MQAVIEALTLGIRDYVEKSNVPGVLIGLSGGIDSAVTAALAVRALGAERVKGVRMPSKFSSQHSLDDAEALAKNLDISTETVNIEPMVESFRLSLKPQQRLTDQNLQARVRGVILMALSNETGFLVLATGNKSELAMGYTTLYGDMCGALMPLGDLYKTQVWDLARAINQEKAVIPESSITKEPSAELAPEQKDRDALPPYEMLDLVLVRHLEHNLSKEVISQETGLGLGLVEGIIAQVNACEFKRKQAAPILMVSKRVFGEARRWPVVSKLAERPGFEPGMEFKPHTHLAGVRLQPLGHRS